MIRNSSCCDFVSFSNHFQSMTPSRWLLCFGILTMPITYAVMFKSKKLKNSFGYLTSICSAWKQFFIYLYRSKFDRKALEEQQQRSKQILKGGITGTAPIVCDYDFNFCWAVTERYFVRAIRAWNLIEIGDAIPNHTVYRYTVNEHGSNPNSYSFVQTELHRIGSHKLTVLNFGSCTYVLPRSLSLCDCPHFDDDSADPHSWRICDLFIRSISDIRTSQNSSLFI